MISIPSMADSLRGTQMDIKHGQWKTRCAKNTMVQVMNLAPAQLKYMRMSRLSGHNSKVRNCVRIQTYRSTPVIYSGVGSELYKQSFVHLT